MSGNNDVGFDEGGDVGSTTGFVFALLVTCLFVFVDDVASAGI
jgi:hypothetical protein